MANCPTNPLSLDALFSQQVATSPQSLALSDRDTELTYLQTRESSYQWAHWLQQLGVTSGDRVALLLEPCVEFVLIWLALVHLKATCVPLDTQAPPKRLQFILNDSTPVVLITNQRGVSPLGVTTYRLHLIKADIACQPKDPLSDVNEKGYNPSTPVCIFYTSGTTGQPKGVMIGEPSIVNLCYVDNFAGLTNTTRFGQFGSFAFDAITFELWTTLIQGGALFILPKGTKQDFQQLKNFIHDYKINTMFFPTSYFHNVVNLAPDTIDELNTVLFGGEALNSKAVRRLREGKKKLSPIVFINLYGPTEGTTVASYQKIDVLPPTEKKSAHADIGRPIQNVKMYILDESLKPVHADATGELFISGRNLALGYLNQPQLTQEKFLLNPFTSSPPYERMYKTGDLVRELPDGNIVYVGRRDDQVKISGHRLHLNEVQQVLAQHPGVGLVAVVAETSTEGDVFLAAYVTLSETADVSTNPETLRTFLAATLPFYMVPTKYVFLATMPLNQSGKIDTHQLAQAPTLHFAVEPKTVVSSNKNLEFTIIQVWEDLLHRPNLALDQTFAELGAGSLLLAQACAQINEKCKTNLNISDLLNHYTIRKLANYLEKKQSLPFQHDLEKKISPPLEIAIVGFACRFPQADTVDEFWNNLCQSKECLTRFEGSYDLNFVPVRGIIPNIECFDASFFRFSPLDASIIDPQQRLFLECAWHALEHSGNVPSQNPEKIFSVFAGMADSSYVHTNLTTSLWFRQQHDWFQTRVATSPGALSTQLSYRLNLQGKSVNINTACSTGLVAVDAACQDLVSGSSDVALAGGVSLDLHQRLGYTYHPQGIDSPDGHCRPFSDKAQGTVFSDGVGVVVLKRLADALNDKDTIYAVIQGCGVNNDGSNKYSYVAPSAQGQQEALRLALRQAQISPDQVGFIETHGTGTALGDAIEFMALNQVYGAASRPPATCVLGSVKGNIGHTDIAAGIGGLIKAALCLHHQKIPPTLYFERPNPELNMEKTPFMINQQTMPWPIDLTPRYAGVSAFGVGGTNAHVILKEFVPKAEKSGKHLHHPQLMLISGKTQQACVRNLKNLEIFLESRKFSLANVAYTLQTAREHFPWRAWAIIHPDSPRLLDMVPQRMEELQPKPLVFLFPGQGSQYVGMAQGLYDSDPYFAAIVDTCRECTKAHLPQDIWEVIQGIHPGLLQQTTYTQAALFTVEYALAKTLMYLGVIPQGLLGHSVGEYVAACIAEVFSLQDALGLVCARGALMEQAAPGQMIAIRCSVKEFLQLKGDLTIDLAAHNAERQCVASGSSKDMEIFRRYLDQNRVAYHILNSQRAFHSTLMDDAAQALKLKIEGLSLHPPRIGIISNVTGQWMTADQATSPTYWAQHMRQTVEFEKSLQTLGKIPSFCLEVGPGSTLTALIQDVLPKFSMVLATTLPNAYKKIQDEAQFLHALGALWQEGYDPIAWEKLHQYPQRVPLPTYAFERQRYWIEPNAQHNSPQSLFFQPQWTRTQTKPPSQNDLQNCMWIIFTQDAAQPWVKALLHIFQEQNMSHLIVLPAGAYACVTPHLYTLRVQEKNDYLQLFKTLAHKEASKSIIVLHGFLCTEVPHHPAHHVQETLDFGFHSLTHLIQAYSEVEAQCGPLSLQVCVQGTRKVLGDEKLDPTRATALGICLALKREYPLWQTRWVDMENQDNRKQAKALLDHSLTPNSEPLEIVAYRRGYRWDLSYAPIQISSTSAPNSFTPRDQGIYVLTGGLGGMAPWLCLGIAEQCRQPTFILISRSTTMDHTNENVWQKVRDLGAHILVDYGDITSMGFVQAFVRKTLAKHGTIHGLIHAAGVAGGGILPLKTKTQAEKVFAPKVQGTYALSLGLQGIPLDFVVLCSSVASVMSLGGQSDYSGANAFLDAFSSEEAGFMTSNLMSINWNTWEHVGMAATTPRPTDVLSSAAENSITPQEGARLFKQVLTSGLSQVVVSRFDPSKPQPQTKAIETVSSGLLQVDGTLTRILTPEETPQNTLEQALADLWRENLGVPLIGLHDDFFALGGHSLRALALLERINQTLGLGIGLTDLYQGKTIAGILKIAAQKSTKKNLTDAVRPLALRSGQGVNIFLIHPVGGLVFCYQSLIESWREPDVSFLGIEDPAIHSKTYAFSNLLEVAQTYLIAIQQIQPQGPYFLVGYSYGGTVAYEIAHLLHQQNQEVKLLAMVDSWAYFSPEQSDETSFKSMMTEYSPGISDFLVDLAWQRMCLLVAHTPSRSSQDIVLFKAQELLPQLQSQDDPKNGWEEYTQGCVTVYSVEGNHETAMGAPGYEQIRKVLEQHLTYKR